MRRLPKIVLHTAVALIVVLALILSGLRLALPYINHWRDAVLLHIAGASGIPVNASQLQAKWQNIGPVFEIRDLHIRLKDGSRLSVKHVSLTVNIWQSLLHRHWQFQDLTFWQLNLQSDNLLNSLQPAGNPQDTGQHSLFSLFFHQFTHFRLRDSNISLLNSNGQRVHISIPQLTWLNSQQRHQAEGVIKLSDFNSVSPQQPGYMQLRMDLYDNGNLINSGNIWLNAENVDIIPWLDRLDSQQMTGVTTRFNLQAWLQLKHGNITGADLRLADGHINWQASQQAHQLQISNLSAHLRPLSNGWQLDIPQTHIMLDNTPWPMGAVSVAWLADVPNQPSPNKQPQWRIRASNLDISKSGGLTSALQHHLPKLTQLWDELQPHGYIDTLALDIPAADPQQTRFRIRWRDLSWQPWHNLPAGNKLTGEISGSLAQGRLTASMQQARVHNPRVFLKPLAIRQASGTIYWQHNSDGLTLNGNNIDIAAESLRLHGDFRYQQPQHGQPWLSMLAGIRLTDARDAWRYYPHNHLSPHLIDYLTHAIQAGYSDNATLLFNGNPRSYPFWNNEGVIEIHIPVHHAQFQFDPDWPAINDFTVNLNFVNDSLSIQADKLTIGGMQARNLRTIIAHYHQPQLLIDADLSGNAQLLQPYFAQTPLHDSLAATLKDLQLTGNINGKLHLDIPLNQHLPQARGEIQLNDNTLYIRPMNLQLSNLTGKFRFIDGELSGSGLQANWLHQPLQLAFSSNRQNQDWKINVQLAADWQANKISGLPPLLRQSLQGDIAWQSEMAIHLPYNGKPNYTIKLNGNFTNLSSRLPAPLDKPPGSALPFNLRATGNMQQLTLSGGTDGKKTSKIRFNSRWLLQPKLRLERAALTSTSSHIPALPAGAQVDLSLPALDGNLWLALMQTGMTNNVADLSLLGQHLNLSVPVLTFANQQWDQFSLHIQPITNGRNLQLHARQLSASLITQQNVPWQASIHYLNYHPVSASDNPVRTLNAVSKIDFRHWPDLQLRCDRCWLWGKDYGRIAANIRITDNTLTLSNGTLDNGLAHLTLAGKWRNQPGDSYTQINGTLQGTKFDKLSQFLALGEPIQGASFNIKYQLNWRDAPWQLHSDSLNGQLSTNLAKGKITGLNTGHTGRLLNLFAVDALLRQLQSNFHNNFSDGFYFNSISSHARIDNGILRTSDTLIKGASADIALQGNVNLAADQLDLHAVVAPEISATVGVATAFAVNPMIGVAVYAASKALSPLWSKISFLRYHISGSLNKPVISEVSRQSGQSATGDKRKPHTRNPH